MRKKGNFAKPGVDAGGIYLRKTSLNVEFHDDDRPDLSEEEEET